MKKGRNKRGTTFVAGVVVTADFEDGFIVAMRKPTLRAAAAPKKDSGGSGTL